MKPGIFIFSAFLFLSSLSFSQTATLGFNSEYYVPGMIEVNIIFNEIDALILGGQWFCHYDSTHLTYSDMTFPHPNFPAEEWFFGSNGEEVGCNWFAPDFVAETILPTEILAKIFFEWDGHCTDLSWGNEFKGITDMYDGNMNQFSLNLENYRIFGEDDIEPPDSIDALVINDSDVNIFWSKVDGCHFLNYSLYRNNEIYIEYVVDTFCLDSNLEEGTYSYCVKSVFCNGESVCSEEVSVSIGNQIFNPPINLSADIIDLTDIHLSWEAPNDSVLGYHIYKNNDYYFTMVETNFMDTNQMMGDYSYCVAAQYNTGTSACSEEVNLSIAYSMDPVSNFFGELIGDEVYLSWITPNPAVIGYNIYVNDNYHATTSSTEFVYDELDYGINSFCVSTIYPDGESICSESFEVFIELPPPNNLEVNFIFPDCIQLTWDAPTKDLIAYNIYLSDGSWLAQTTQSIQICNFSSGEYCFYVTAVYDEGESGPSNIDCAEVILEPPTYLTAEIVMWEYVDLSWIAPQGKNDTKALLGYNVYFDDGSLIDFTIETSYLYGPISPGTYCFYITAVYSSGESIPSNIECLSGPMFFNPPNNLNVDYDQYNSEIQLNWEEPDPSSHTFEGYNIYKNGDLISMVQQETEYIDEDLCPGETEYCVTAIYLEGESFCTDSLVEIFPPMEYFPDFNNLVNGGQLACQECNWRTWDGFDCGDQDAYISDEVAWDGNAVKFINGNDILFLTETITSGIDKSFTFRMYIPDGQSAHFGVLQEFSEENPQYGLVVNFEENGIATAYLAGDTDQFSFNHNDWFSITFLFAAYADCGSLYYNSSHINRWQWSVGAYGNSDLNQLNGIEFWADEFYVDDRNNDGQFYLDDFMFGEFCGVSCMSGVEDIQLDNIYIYPNPAKDIINIESDDILRFIVLYSPLGQIKYSNMPNNFSDQIDCSNLSNGLYILELYSDNKKHYKKVVIK